MALRMNNPPPAADAWYQANEHADFNVKDFTIEAWINPINPVTTQRVLSRQGTEYYLMDVGRNGDGNLGVGSSRDAVLSSDSAGSMNGVRTHVAIVRKAGSYIRWLRNGVQTKQVAITDVGAYTTDVGTPLLAFKYTGGEHFRGTCEELRFWNVARETEDIARTMRTRLPMHFAGLVGYWRLDDADAVPATLRDFSGLGHPMTKNGTRVDIVAPFPELRVGTPRRFRM